MANQLQQESTEWDDVLTKFGIKKPADDQNDVPQEGNEPSLGSDSDDEEDEEILRRYREMRIAEMMSLAQKPLFAEVEEISGQDFVEKVSKAGADVCVVIHLYKPGVLLCSLINQMLPQLATRFPQTKFLKSISSLCIANFPDENLPGLLIYRNGKCAKQMFGPQHFGVNLRLQDLEWILHKHKAVASDMTEDPRKEERREKGTKFFQSIESEGQL